MSSNSEGMAGSVRRDMALAAKKGPFYYLTWALFAPPAGVAGLWGMSRGYRDRFRATIAG